MICKQPTTESQPVRSSHLRPIDGLGRGVATGDRCIQLDIYDVLAAISNEERR
jgi:hypothetical protein